MSPDALEPDTAPVPEIPYNTSPLARWQVALVLSVLLVTLAYRWNGIAVHPPPHATDDEYHYLWAGLSLLETGHVRSWSLLGVYSYYAVDFGELNYQAHKFAIREPALDHPPLFSLIVGGFAKLWDVSRIPFKFKDGRESWVWEVDLGRTRLITLPMYALAFLFLFELVRRAWSFGPAILAVSLYGTIGHIVLHNRLLLTENLTIPLLLLNLVVVHRYLAGRTGSRVMATTTILCVSAAMLSKLIACAQAGAVAYLLIVGGKPRKAFHALWGVLLGGVIYFLYGASQDLRLFLLIQGFQSERFVGFDAWRYLVQTPRLLHDLDTSLLLLVGWLCLFAAATHRRSGVVAASAFAYLALFVFFAPANALYGWHVMPFYPFLCMGLGVVIYQVCDDCRPAPSMALMALLLPLAMHVMYEFHIDWKDDLRIAYLALTAIVLVLMTGPDTVRKRGIRLLTICSLFIILMKDFWNITLFRE